MTARPIAEQVYLASRKAQGLPPRVTDRQVLGQIAILVDAKPERAQIKSDRKAIA